MFCFIVLTVTLTIALADDIHKCHILFNPNTIRCCKMDLPPPEVNNDDLAECFKLPPDPHSCEVDICIGKKRGYASDDGTIDKNAYEKLIEEDFKTTPTLVESLKDNCVKGDLSKVGPPDACELARLKICIEATIILDCKEWDNTGLCTGVKDLAKECSKLDN